MTPTLTWRRLLGQLAIGAGALLLIIAIAPLIGVAQDQDGTWRVIINAIAAWWDGAQTDHWLLWHLRLPRVLAAAVVGAALGAAGAAAQATLRNPLAEPYTLGVSAGATLAAVIGIRLGIDRSLGMAAISLCALAGALGATAVVLRLARSASLRSPATLLLAGITVTTICSSASLFVQFSGQFSDEVRIYRWLLGGFSAVAASHVAIAAAVVLPAIVLLTRQGHAYNALGAGADVAQALGVDVRALSRRTFLLSSLMVGVAIAISGPIGFVGLLVPHAVRALAGPDHRSALPLSALWGAALLVVADTVARAAFTPNPLPVGILTALVGGPFLLVLLRRL